MASIPFPFFGNISQFFLGEPPPSLLLAQVFPDKYDAACSFNEAKLACGNQANHVPCPWLSVQERTSSRRKVM